jgi:hypothetical protein
MLTTGAIIAGVSIASAILSFLFMLGVMGGGAVLTIFTMKRENRKSIRQVLEEKKRSDKSGLAAIGTFIGFLFGMAWFAISGVGTVIGIAVFFIGGIAWIVQMLA